jgi:hypothetical protein
VPLIRKSDIEAIGGWDPELRQRQAQGCEDWQVYLRLAERTDYALEPAFLVGYRQATQAMSRQVASMQRSYRLVLAEARARHPDLPPALFRWSEAAFDFYAFELMQGLTSRWRRLPCLLRGILRDPGWLTRPSTHRKLRYWLKRGIAPRTQPKPAAFPVGQPFSVLSPDAHWDVSEGATISARRSLVASLPIRRQLGA